MRQSRFGTGNGIPHLIEWAARDYVEEDVLAELARAKPWLGTDPRDFPDHIRQRACEEYEQRLKYYPGRLSSRFKEETDCIPARFRLATCNLALDDVGLYLHGPVGTGKTHAAAALAIQAVNAGLYINWVSTSSWLHAIKASFNGAPAPDDACALLEHTDLLVIDDIGSEKPTDWAIETLFVLVNEAYERDTQLIVTSNLKCSDLAKRLGDRIGSRLVELCDPVEFSGTDRRLLTARARRG